MYQNYHRHSDHSNFTLTDSAVKNEDYAKRTVALGGQIMSSCEHGNAGDYFNCYDLAKKYGLKFRYVAEVYFVKNRFDKDNTNCHMILAARNKEGLHDLNWIISEAYISGFYYRPRVDLELLLSLNPNNVFVTTACMAGVWAYGKCKNEDTGSVYYDFMEPDRIIRQLHSYFGNNFMLEVQNHNVDTQKELNRHILQLYRSDNIPMIFGADSHFILPEDAVLRDMRLQANGLHYEDEDGFYMDYPSEEEAIRRFEEQGVLPRPLILEAINNTNVFLDFDEIEFSTEKKIPTIYPNLTQEERNQKFIDLIDKLWAERKPSIPEERWAEYEEGIEYERSTIVDTNTSDYFLLNYEIVRTFKEMGGHLTYTGRGSAPSFYINNLLGFTSIDRFALPITMYPDRFISKDRLLAGNLPDIDFNVWEADIFAKAQQEVLGRWNAIPMSAYGTLKRLAAFKMYARANNLPFETANEVSQKLKEFELAYKHADEDERENITPYQYVEEKYHDILRGSEEYLGIVDSISPHPCAYLLSNQDIRREIGIIRLKSKDEKEPVYAALADGATLERMGYLKNDDLSVTVVKLIAKIYERIGIPQPTVPELIALTAGDTKTWSMYAKGYTLGLNQVEKSKSTEKVMTYKPRNISEMSAFVAGIRPAFQSMLNIFLNREHFDYKIKALDDLLQTPEMRSSFILYQEQMMKVLQYAGFTAPESYSAIKAIAKKHPEKVLPLKERFLTGFSNKLEEIGSSKEDAKRTADKVWTICSDACGYGFNSCLTGDTTIYREMHKHGSKRLTIAEMYRICHDKIYAESTGHKYLRHKYRTYGYGTALSLGDDHRIYKNKIKDIRYVGVRPVFLLTTENGSTVRCTANHKFPVVGEPEMIRLDQLQIGQEIYFKAGYETSKNMRRFNKNDAESNIPKKGQLGFQHKPDGGFVLFKAYRQQCVDQHRYCDVCHCDYKVAKHFELHHADNDSTNNNADNLMWVCNSCHKKLHYRGLNRRGRFSKGLLSRTEKIVSIVPCGKEEVYDVEMESPNHNFVIGNCMIVGNSHSTATALDSIYVAYAKAHYPLETYATMLEIYADRGDKDKIDRCKKEMYDAFKIQCTPCKFGEDNRSFTIRRDENAISDILSSMKGVGVKDAESLYRLRDFKTDSFVDLLYKIQKAPYINDHVIRFLIKSNYFRDWGKNGKLLAIYDEFKSGDLRINDALKPDTRLKRMDALRQMERTQPDVNLPMCEQLTFEIDAYGSPKSISTDPFYKGRYMIVDVDVKYSPKILLYRIDTGASNTLKMLKGMWNKKQLQVGDIIHILNYTRKPAVKFVEENGKKVPRMDYNKIETWIEDCEVIERIEHKDETCP